MEEMYFSFVFFSFINGALLIATVYYVITAHKTKVAYESMLEHQSSLQARQSYENQMLREKAEGMEILILDIQSNMEKDNYSDLSSINNKIRTLETVTENHSQSFKLAQDFEKRIAETISNINQWRKRMGEDPTLIRGY
jgi:hypothetical protein